MNRPPDPLRLLRRLEHFDSLRRLEEQRSRSRRRRRLALAVLAAILATALALAVAFRR